MLIKSKFYEHLHQKLWEAFYKNEWTGKHKLKYCSQTLWEVRNSRDQYVVMKKIFDFTGVGDIKYFYKKSLALDPKRTAVGEVYDDAIYYALLYMGYKLPVSMERDTLAKRALNLFQQYKDAYGLADETGKDETRPPGSERDINEPESPAVKYDEGGLVNEPPQDDTDLAKAVILKFFGHIGSGDYDEAWEQMSEDFKNRKPWNGDVSRFKQGYVNTVGLKNVIIFDTVQRQATVVECKVYYEDQASLHSSPDLSAIQPMFVKDLDDFVHHLKRLKYKVEEKGGDIDNIELYKLFEKSASEYIWYNSQLKPEDITDVFPHRTTAFIERVYNCSCKLKDGVWQINRIWGVMAQSAR